MSDKRVFVMAHPMARKNAEVAVRQAPEGWRVTISPPLKSRLQEEKYHAMIGDIADQYTHAGRKWGDEDMKRLLVAAFKEETKHDPDLIELWREMGELRLVPGLRGDTFVALGDQTRKFPKALAIAFIEWLDAFGAENAIVWSEPKSKQRPTARELADADGVIPDEAAHATA